MAASQSNIFSLSSCFTALITIISILQLARAQLSSSSLETFPDVLKLPANFDPIIAAYWTGLPHHRRTPFCISPDGKSAYLAFLDSSHSSVWVQQVDPSTFTAVGDPVNVPKAREAGGLVAQNDGFALLATVPAEGSANLPPNNYPIAAIFRYKNGNLVWKTVINGPEIQTQFGLEASPDMNGDLVYSEKAGLYAAYIVVTAYSGDASGHFGDAITYIDDTGTIKTISGASSSWGCSHNTGIALEEADAAPFASVCAEDHGAIWLNTGGLGMAGAKIANENTTNGCSGEPMGGMSGSYSSLALFPGTTQYIFAWQSRGAVNLKPDSWMGDGYTACDPRWLNHNVAIAITKDKSTLARAQAISTVGATSGDDQVDWITESSSVDHQNVHVATFDSGNAVVTWEELETPDCQPVPLGCSGTFSGTYFQQVNRQGAKVGAPIKADNVYVSGDIINIGNERLCWPYVNMTWDLSAPKSSGTPVTQMSFACLSIGGGSGPSNTPSSSIVSPVLTSTTLTTSTPTMMPNRTVTHSGTAPTTAKLHKMTHAHTTVCPTEATAITILMTKTITEKVTHTVYSTWPEFPSP